MSHQPGVRVRFTSSLYVLEAVDHVAQLGPFPAERVVGAGESGLAVVREREMHDAAVFG